MIMIMMMLMMLMMWQSRPLAHETAITLTHDRCAIAGSGGRWQ